MLDINGAALAEGDTAQLLCEIRQITGDGIVVRVMNSEMELLIGAKHDEVLGGMVADSELTLFEGSAAREAADPADLAHDDQADGVKILFE